MQLSAHSNIAKFSTRVPTRTSGEAVPQAHANHLTKEEQDQELLCTQVTMKYDKRRVPCGKIKSEDKSVCYHMDLRACSGSPNFFYLKLYSTLRYRSTIQ